MTYDPTYWTYDRFTVETFDGGEESYYELKTDGRAYTVRIEQLEPRQWFVWITHREDGIEVGVYTNLVSGPCYGFRTLRDAKRFGYNWVLRAIDAAA